MTALQVDEILLTVPDPSQVGAKLDEIQTRAGDFQTLTVNGVDISTTVVGLATHIADTSAHGVFGNNVGTSGLQTIHNKTLSTADNTIEVLGNNLNNIIFQDVRNTASPSFANLTLTLVPNDNASTQLLCKNFPTDTLEYRDTSTLTSHYANARVENAIGAPTVYALVLLGNTLLAEAVDSTSTAGDFSVGPLNTINYIGGPATAVRISFTISAFYDANSTLYFVAENLDTAVTSSQVYIDATAGTIFTVSLTQVMLAASGNRFNLFVTPLDLAGNLNVITQSLHVERLNV